MTITPTLLSASVDGQPIELNELTAPGVLLHKCPAGTAMLDQIGLWAVNTTAADVTLSVLWGGKEDPQHYLCRNLVLPANSPPVPIAYGFRLRNGLSIWAFCSVDSAVNIIGTVDRIS